MFARSPFWKAASAFALIVASLALGALSFGPCGGGYFTLVPGALLFIWGVGKIIALITASLNL
jgi:hypothetical protein